MGSRPSRRFVRVVASAAAVAATVSVIVTGSVAAQAAPVLTVDPHGTIDVQVKGNGHGHGMSQYGAQGAALAGLTYQRIVSFYYPHTQLTRLTHSTIRVLLSDTGSTTSVAAYPGLTVTGVSGVLPAARVDKYRLTTDHSGGLTLQQLKTGAARWHTYATHLTDGATFRRKNGYSIRQFLSDGSSTRYFGSLAAYRKGSGVYTVNRLTLDQYAAGVAPREMPASWQHSALQAQAVAARTFGRYGVLHPRGRTYDICDNTMCQVYGGHVHYYANGSRAWTDDWDAVSGDEGQVLEYNGAVIFAQFSASDGGYTADGGQPYLTAHADPYDNGASGDPYLSYVRSSSASSVASYFGLGKVSSITITGRDGHGAWGGRVTAGVVKGTTAGGRATSVNVSGFDLQYAFGLGSTLFRPVS